jgi:hypothetical protein
MKIQRKWLLIATASIGVFMILYTLARQFLGLDFGAAFEKLFFDGVFIAAIGLLMLNRKLGADEKKAALEAKEKEEEAEAEETEADSGSVHDETDTEGR